MEEEKLAFLNEKSCYNTFPTFIIIIIIISDKAIK